MEEVDYDEEVSNEPSRTTHREKMVRSTSEGGGGGESSHQELRTKGRGHSARVERNEGRGGVFEQFHDEEGPRHGPAKSVEGWIVFVTNVHPEAQEEDIVDKFQDFGDVKNISMNLDRRTGFVKGYALIEFETYEEGAEAIRQMNGKDLMGQTVGVDWSFVKD